MTLIVYLLVLPNCNHRTVKFENVSKIQPLYDNTQKHIGFIIDGKKHVFDLIINSFKVTL